PRTASTSCAPSSRTSSSDQRNSPSATASRSASTPAAAATTTPKPTRRVTCAKVRCCVGGVVSPVLSNIYLHKLDEFAETVLIPEYTRGGARKSNPAYRKIADAISRARKRGDAAVVRELRKQQRSLPSRDTRDPGYRRLRYARYADDHLLGLAGPKAEADQIKARLAAFLRD